MLLLRVGAYLVAAAIAVMLGLFVFTRDRRYLRVAGRLAKWAIVFALAVFALLVLERMILTAG
ncbi:MAG: hypothetical protein IT515_09270 [Burkholderiales bacterium]|nr:hypothetical protein [Burkholderiales bacterium]